MNGLIVTMSKQELTEVINTAVREAITEYRLQESEKAEPIACTSSIMYHHSS
jgi:metal-responsive CopG/Arc/MetJ family transcriptional regulator